MFSHADYPFTNLNLLQVSKKRNRYSILIRIFAAEINEKEEKMKTDRITSPIRKQGFRAS